MNISKNSWHYKAVDRFGTRTAKNKFDLGCHTTCTYIRAVTWSLIAALWFSAIMLVFIAFIVGTVVSMIAAPIQLIMGVVFEKGTWAAFAYAFGAAGWGITSAVLILFIVTIIRDRQPSAEEKASLIKQAYADKVDGICTLVKLTD
jgi:hypothetical protein